MRRYELAYSLLPDMIDLCNQKKLNPQALLDVDFWKNIVRKIYPDELEDEFDWNEISVDFKPLEAEMAAILIVFPTPKQGVEAKYGIIIVNRTEQTFKYYTLEYDEFGTWYIGSMKDRHHNNYGILDTEPSMENFLDKVLSL